MKYTANFLWGFEDDSIEAIGYEFANAKTEEYQKECWLALIEKIKCSENTEPNQSLINTYENYIGALKTLIPDRYSGDTFSKLSYWDKKIEEEKNKGKYTLDDTEI